MFKKLPPSFKEKHNFEKRLLDSKRIMQKYPYRGPVICVRVGLTDIPLIDKNKYLVKFVPQYLFYIILNCNVNDQNMKISKIGQNKHLVYNL